VSVSDVEITVAQAILKERGPTFDVTPQARSEIQQVGKVIVTPQDEWCDPANGLVQEMSEVELEALMPRVEVIHSQVNLRGGDTVCLRSCFRLLDVTKGSALRLVK
jgi:hypothetical protein